jgi:hypothetical protein
METHEDELYGLLQKVGGNTTPQTSTGDDEGESTKGVTQVYEDPPGVETMPRDDNQGFSTGAVAADKTVREGVVNNVLDSKPKTDQADRALVRQNFTQAKPGAYVSHSVHLQGEEPKVAHPRSESLVRAVERLTGRR